MTEHKQQELLNALKALWGVHTQDQDTKALALINDLLQSDATQEDYAIQQKVLAKTRQKTEALLKRVEALEQGL